MFFWGLHSDGFQLFSTCIYGQTSWRLVPLDGPADNLGGTVIFSSLKGTSSWPVSEAIPRDRGWSWLPSGFDGKWSLFHPFSISNSHASNSWFSVSVCSAGKLDHFAESTVCIGYFGRTGADGSANQQRPMVTQATGQAVQKKTRKGKGCPGIALRLAWQTCSQMVTTCLHSILWWKLRPSNWIKRASSGACRFKETRALNQSVNYLSYGWGQWRCQSIPYTQTCLFLRRLEGWLQKPDETSHKIHRAFPVQR